MSFWQLPLPIGQPPEETPPADAAPAEPTPASHDVDSVNDAVDILQGKLEGWLHAAILKLPDFVVAVLVVLLFWALSRLVRKLLTKAFSHTAVSPPIRNLVVTMGGIGVILAGLFVALGVLGLDKTVASLLGAVGIIGLALGFAFQSIAANFMSGLLLSIRRPFSIGDTIRTNDFFGVVQDINLRSTVVQTPEGQIVRIPNQQVFENPIINFSTTGRRRIDLAVGVSYGDDLETAKKLAVEAVESIEDRLKDRPVELFYEAFGASSIDFVVRFWIAFRRQSEYMDARSEAVQRVKKAFDDNDITIPFPIRTLDFGIVGGEKLSEALPTELFAARSTPALSRKTESSDPD